MSLKYGNIDISFDSNCPEHCQNCKNLKAVQEDNGFSDEIGFTACDDIIYYCDETDSPCPADKSECSSVVLPPLCKNCAECTDCIFTEKNRPKVDLSQLQDCLKDGLHEYLYDYIV